MVIDRLQAAPQNGRLLTGDVTGRSVPRVIPPLIAKERVMDQSRHSESRSAHESASSFSGGSVGQFSASVTERQERGGADSRPDEPSAQEPKVVAQAQEQAGKLVDIAREQATTQLATQKTRAASSLGSLAMALHDVSRQMRDQDDATLVTYVETAAGQIDRLAGMLNEQDVEQLLQTTEQFARRQPALFLASAFALGFVGARFLRSSPRMVGEPSGTKSDLRWGGTRDSLASAGRQADDEARIVDAAGSRMSADWTASASASAPGGR
jgi:hypothetical protein